MTRLLVQNEQQYALEVTPSTAEASPALTWQQLRAWQGILNVPPLAPSPKLRGAAEHDAHTGVRYSWESVQ